MFLSKLFGLFIIGSIAYYLYRLLWKGGGRNSTKNKRKPTPNSSTPTPQVIEEMKKDPVCGTYIPEHEAIVLNSLKGKQYFCSEGCKKKYVTLNK